jgi:hypothetical protein
MSTYVIYHPGTGTFVAADDSVLIKVEDLPQDFDEWEDYMSWSGVRTYAIEVGSEIDE